MVFYAAFNSISVISRRQLTLFMLSWVSPVLGWALKCLAQGHSHEIDIFNEKRKSCNYRCPDSVYFHTLLLIIYLSAIEIIICSREMNLVGSTSFGFAQNTMHDCQNTVLNS